MNTSEKMGNEPIPKILFKQSLPSAIGILTLSVYGIVDTIFVGKFVGSMAIGAITVVLPITFLISSLGMALGVGGGSMIARALGSGDKEKAYLIFGNQTILTVSLSMLVMTVSYLFYEPILRLFGGQGELLAPAAEYFLIVLPATPFLAWAMMSNNVLRAEGKPKIAMFTMFIPALVNVGLDPLLIVYFEMGLAGAAWATTIAYVASGIFTFWFFASGKSQLSLNPIYLKPVASLSKEILSIGGVTFARQGSVSLLSIVLNNSLFNFGGEMAISAYGIINRLMMLASFPVFGVTQGFLPIAGYNYGAGKLKRVKEVIFTAIKFGSLLSLAVFILMMIFASQLIGMFTNDAQLIQDTTPALRWIFLLTPLITIQLIGPAYYQAIGKALPALILTLLKQGFFLIPLVFILPKFYGLNGIWYAFPIADSLAAIVCFIFLRKSYKKLEAQKTA
jgi:putative MATE family efflux protein